MHDIVMLILDLSPLAAAACAVPQFVPQLRKAKATADVNGVSWSWAVLTSTNNAAWTVYFAMSGFWLALVPSISATVLSGLLAATIASTTRIDRRRAATIVAWVLALAVAFSFAGRVGLGVMLSAAFVIQVAPAIWTAYRTTAPTGIAAGTWLLVLGELACWAVYGLHRRDGRLAMMGCTGVVAGLLMLLRVIVAHRRAGSVGDDFCTPVEQTAGA